MEVFGDRPCSSSRAATSGRTARHPDDKENVCPVTGLKPQAQAAASPLTPGALAALTRAVEHEMTLPKEGVSSRLKSRLNAGVEAVHRMPLGDISRFVVSQVPGEKQAHTGLSCTPAVAVDAAVVPQTGTAAGAQQTAAATSTQPSSRQQQQRSSRPTFGNTLRTLR